MLSAREGLRDLAILAGPLPPPSAWLEVAVIFTPRLAGVETMASSRPRALPRCEKSSSTRGCERPRRLR